MDQICESIARWQADDPFSPVTVVVPSPFARVQLRRAIGATRGICNVGFRTWGELTTELGRSGTGPSGRVATPRVVNEALRQVLMSTSSPFDSFVRSPLALAELVGVLYELWRAGPSLLSLLVEHGGRAESLVATLAAVEAHLAEHGFTDPGRLLDLAATAPVDRHRVGAVVLWHPRPARGRDRAVLEHLGDSGVPVGTIAADPDADAPIGQVIECSDPDEEVRVVARRLIAAVEEGVPLWRQAVIHPPFDRYRRIVHQQLAAAGVASSGPSQMSLDRSVTGRTLVGLLGLASAEWRRADVMGWLGAAPITNGPQGPRVPVNRWDAVSARAGVVEGLGQWRTRLLRFADGGASRDLHVAHSGAEAQSARALVEFMDRLAEDLDPRCGRWSEWAAWAARLLDLYLHPDDRAEDWPPAELVAARAVREVLADLSGLDDVADGADLAAFRHAVEDELASHAVRDETEIARPGSEDDPDHAVTANHVGLPGPVGSGVFVGSPTEARGLMFARVYVVGMADQFLPGTAPRSTLIPESELDEADWPSSARRAEELLDDLRAVLALVEHSAVVSWPRFDPRTGREHVRSRWLDPAERLSTEWTEETVPSFSADVTGVTGASIPVSASDRLLGELARAVSSGRPIERHPAVVHSDRANARGHIPPIRESVAAAQSPLLPGFSRFEGNVGPGRARGIDNELSPTRLEQYASCPRRYLLDRELQLQVPFRPEATEQMEAKDRGTLVHEILATYVGERINDGTPASIDRLVGIAEHRFTIAEEEGRCGSRLMAGVERANLMSELRRFFDEDTLEPVAVELAFGRAGARDDVADDRLGASADLSARKEPVAAVRLDLADGRTVRFGGSVDRIDRGPNDSLVVSDYQTGRQSTLYKQLRNDPVAGGAKLQLPIYALAAKAYLEWDGAIHARYWLTSWNREDESLLCTLDETLHARLREVVSTIAKGIETGAFPGVPGDETFRYDRPAFEHCFYCDFDKLCPSDRDRRWSGIRDAPEVAPVVALGESPGHEFEGVVSRTAVDLTRENLS